MAAKDRDILTALRALPPQAREQAAAFIQSLAAGERHHGLDAEERRRILRETRGAIPREQARELLRIGREAFDRLDEDSCPSQ